MSSLAGALIPQEDYSYSHNPTRDALTEVAADSDVDMQPPDIKPNEPSTRHNDVSAENGDEEMEDLFGNDEDVDDVKAISALKSESAPPASPGESGFESEGELSQAEKERRKALEYAEPEEPATLVEHPQEANVSIPNIPVPRGSDGDHWVIRMPNFVKVDSKPFHPDTYIGPEHEDEEAHQAESIREKSMTIKLKVENTLRWRWIKDEFGQDKKQSNSRVIRWSDGTLSLLLGKELFDINKTVDTSAAVARSSLGGSQASQSSIPPASQQIASGSKSQGLTYLVAQHKRSELLQAEAVVTGYMSLRPTGMQSETHRMLVRAVGQKHNKVARLRMAPDPTMDPEREKMELIKLSAKKSKKKADDSGFGGRKRRANYTRKRPGHDVWSDDEDEHEGDYAEEDDDMRTPRSAKRRVEDDKKKGGEYQEDDFVVADDSDEDAEYTTKSKHKHISDEEDAEEDPLDRLDAQISQQENERKRKHRDSGEGAEHHDENVGGDQSMDIESEEEEDEVRVRKSGARKKRAVGFDEEEDEE